MRTTILYVEKFVHTNSTEQYFVENKDFNQDEFEISYKENM